jgi:cysteinyl-tRNA synthetase
MTLRLHNTLSGRTEDFRPVEPGVARLYTCGPTVWNFAHVGNCRTFLVYDLLRRHLTVSGYRVRHVMNVTDVDDRIIEQAIAAGIGIAEFVQPYQLAFLEDLRTLRAQEAELYPRATGHVEEMMALIERLMEGGHAYEVDGDVYFRIDSFPAYGALSHLDRAGLRPGARVATDKYDKESATDFALWKRARAEDESAGAAWEASFGRGRPGWHIECSAMAMKYLGETLDIHAGGIDLLFPHHENEIAQSEAATGRQFARYWVHANYLTDASGIKQSKSDGNFTTLRELVDAGHDPLAVRLFLLGNAHYRSTLRLTDEGLAGAAVQLQRLRDFTDRVRRTEPGLPPAPPDPPPGGQGGHKLFQAIQDARDAYRAALDDDLNLPEGLGVVFELIREANAALDGGRVGAAARQALLDLLDDVDAHLDVLREDEVTLDDAVERLIEERETARRSRDFATADRIRDELRDRGIVLEDSRDGVRWKLARR